MIYLWSYKPEGHHEYDEVVQRLFEEEIIYYKDDFDSGEFPRSLARILCLEEKGTELS